MPEPKHPSGYRVGIVNPLTLVGTEIKSILRERSFPLAKTVLMATGKTAGALTEVDDEPVYVLPVSDDELEDLDLVFFCGPAEENREWIQRAEEDRFVAIDLSQPSTAEEGRVAVAGINLEQINAGDRIVISPHPVAIPIALILHQIARLSRVELCAATVVQPASELEQVGVEELAKQTISVLNVSNVTKDVFDRQLAFNLYPAPEHNEEFIVAQIRQLIDVRTQVALLITQGTIFHSHTFSLFVKTEEELETSDVEESLRANPAIVLPEGDQQFGTIDAAGKDEVLVSEVRRDPTIAGGFWVWAVCDNLRRSSALNAVLVAEKVLFTTGVTELGRRGQGAGDRRTIGRLSCPLPSALCPLGDAMQDFYEPKVGDVAPDFRLPSTRGKDISLGELRGQDVILYFYPKDDTPGCTAEACSFRDHEADISKAHAAVLGVSTDPLESHEKFRQKLSLNFPLLSDAMADVAKMYGAWKEKNLYGRRSWGVARTTYWIGPDGRIKKIYKKVDAARHAEEVLADLNAAHQKK